MPECPDCGEDAVNMVPDAKSKKEIKNLEVACKQCGWKGKFNEIDDHFPCTSPQIILCPYSAETKCCETFPQKDLSDHLTNYQEKHLTGALKTIRDLNATTSELKTQVAELSMKLAETQECTQPQVPPLIFPIMQFRSDLDKFEKISRSNPDEIYCCWYTPPFYTHNRGYKLKLCVTAVVKACQCRKITFSVEALPGKYDCELTNIRAEVKAEILHPYAHLQQGRPLEHYLLEIPPFSIGRRLERMTIDEIPEISLKVSSEENNKEKQLIMLQDYCRHDGLYIRVSNVKLTPDKPQFVFPDYKITGELQSQVAKLTALVEKSHTPPLIIVMPIITSQKETWHSPPFYTSARGYKMRLETTPSGSYHKLSMSIKVSMMTGDNDDYLKWPCKGTLYVEILNPQENSSVESMQTSFSLKQSVINTSNTYTAPCVTYSGQKAWPNEITITNFQQYIVQDSSLYIQISKVELRDYNTPWILSPQTVK